MRTLAFASLIVVLASGCPGGKGGGGGGGPPAEIRMPAVTADTPLHGRVEGTSAKNDCSSDAGCFKGGCSSEVCSAEEGVITTCEAIEKPFPADAACGCVQGQCVWYLSNKTSPPSVGAAQAMRCDDGKCATGLSCVKYYGIAGPSGPQFTSCEIPCHTGESACPPDQACITIADGPGRVCRPRAAP